MPACSNRWRNLWWLIVACSLLTACQAFDRTSVQTPVQTSEITSTVPSQPAGISGQPCNSVKPESPDTRVITRTEVIYQPVEVDSKLTVGAVEKVVFPNMRELKLDARIDTGAETSSLHVTSAREFERDGSRWVSFRVPVEGQDTPMVIERPLARRVLIKRKGEESQRRLVVMLTVQLGKLERTSEFTLTDRENFQFPALIGRNFLTDMAIVDVSHEYLATDR